MMVAVFFSKPACRTSVYGFLYVLICSVKTCEIKWQMEHLFDWERFLFFFNSNKMSGGLFPDYLNINNSLMGSFLITMKYLKGYML